MFSYLLRRILYSVPILLGVVLLTFVLFFAAQTPKDLARKVLGQNAREEAKLEWIHRRGYDKPLLFNTQPGAALLDSQFCNFVNRLAHFDLGLSDKTGESLNEKFAEGAVPSLCITLPAFLVGICLSVGLALYQVFVRESVLDRLGTFICVALMSVPAMVYIIFGQSVLTLALNWFPVSGFSREGFSSAKFLIMPVILMVVMRLGSEVRLYRAIFIEEIGQDYIRTARAKGVSNPRLLLTHVLKNGMIALITLVVAQLPMLILGSLLIESFFGIPGLGGMLFNAFQQGDLAIVQAMVFITSLLYIIGLTLTDILYAAVDPRIRLS